jgi:nitrogen-specific signal transduction histidine kinase/CheY-like chemotaxis protein
MSARENAESQLRQMQKMEAIGQLTGGIAHDFNNMLSIVISSLEMLQRRLQKGEPDFQKYIDAASEGARRAAVLTSRLLAFSRQQPLKPDILDTNKIVSSMSELLQRTLGETIRVETVLAAGLWKTFADSAQVENAMVNLAVNARDAMPDGGRLTIETANVFLDEVYARGNDVQPGQYVLLAITDTGTGMPQAVIDKAFDPFFTTKDVGLGTGLGLSQVFGFVKQSNGHIKIYSEVGQGTTIKIYLPRHYGKEEARVDSPSTAPLAASIGQECILVVEDDEGVRTLTVDALRELGYVVLEASAAPQALGLIGKHPEIALLLTDVVMPDTNGRKLAEAALNLRPDLKVLYMTGFTRNAVVHNGMLDPGVNLIAKPFTLDQLATKVRAVITG